MAWSLQFLLLFTLCFFTVHLVSEKPILPNRLVLPVTKDPSTFQYVTKLYMGNTLSLVKLVVDLGGPFLWVDCASTFQESSLNTIKSCSIQCSMANLSSCNKAAEQGTMACRVKPVNSITRMAVTGYLAEARVAMMFTDGSISSISNFFFSCSPELLTDGLAYGAKGMLGLGNTRISLPSQISNTFGYHRKFFMCLSPLSGAIFLGDIPNVLHIGSEVPKSMTYTPFSSKQDGYYINVKSIKIAGKKLSINSTLLSANEKCRGGTKVSTILPYTTKERTIYDSLIRGYAKVAISMNMTRVAAVAPFGACFSSEGVKDKGFGSGVPTIDLVLQSEMVKWRIYGRNSVIKVSDEVICLGFLDGGLNPEASIVIGGYQLEDNLLEFNLGTAMLGFSSLTRCSDLLASHNVLI